MFVAPGFLLPISLGSFLKNNLPIIIALGMEPKCICKKGVKNYESSCPDKKGVQEYKSDCLK